MQQLVHRGATVDTGFKYTLIGHIHKGTTDTKFNSTAKGTSLFMCGDFCTDRTVGSDIAHIIEYFLLMNL